MSSEIQVNNRREGEQMLTRDYLISAHNFIRNVREQLVKFVKDGSNISKICTYNGFNRKVTIERRCEWGKVGGQRPALPDSLN